MSLLVLSVVLALVAGVGVVVNVHRLRFGRRTAREIATLISSSRPPPPGARSIELPAPVARYRARAVGDRAPVRTLRMRHAGTFCTSRTTKPSPIEGEQVFTADPPGFVWTSRGPRSTTRTRARRCGSDRSRSRGPSSSAPTISPCR